MYEVVIVNDNETVGELGEYESLEEAKAEANSYNRKSDRHPGIATVQKRLGKNRSNPQRLRRNPVLGRRSPPPSPPMESVNTHALIVDSHTQTPIVLRDDAFLANMLRLEPDRYTILQKGEFYEMIQKRNHSSTAARPKLPLRHNPNAAWDPYVQAIYHLVRQWDSGGPSVKPKHITALWEPLDGGIEFQGNTTILYNADGDEITRHKNSRYESLASAIRKLGQITNTDLLIKYEPKPKKKPAPFKKHTKAPGLFGMSDWSSYPTYPSSESSKGSSWSKGKSGSYTPKPIVLQPAYGGVLINSEGKILVVEPANHFSGMIWTFPKGKQDSGETPEESALREVEEESGWTGKIIAPVPGEWKGSTSLTKYFLMEPVGEQGEWQYQGTGKEETWRTEWVDYDCAKLLVSSNHKKAKERDLEVLDKAYTLWMELNG